MKSVRGSCGKTSSSDENSNPAYVLITTHLANCLVGIHVLPQFQCWKGVLGEEVSGAVHQSNKDFIWSKVTPFSTTNLALHSCDIEIFFYSMHSFKTSTYFIHNAIHLLIVAANVASCRWPQTEGEKRITEVWWPHFFLTAHPQIFFHFQTCSFQSQPIYQTWQNFLWSHKKPL